MAGAAAGASASAWPGAASPRRRGSTSSAASARGKSMLMDMFFAGAPVAKKRRVHFHAFMLEVHQSPASLAAARRAAIRSRPWPVHRRGGPPSLLRRVPGRATSPMPCCSAACSRRCSTTASSSSRPRTTRPTISTRTGCSANTFCPSSPSSRSGSTSSSSTAARITGAGASRTSTVYHTPLGAAATAALDAAFARLTDVGGGGADGPAVQGRRLELRADGQGRRLCQLRRALRARRWVPADFLAIATHFHTLILDGVPRLSADQRNEARRFITLIDALYEHRSHLVCAGRCLPDRLYPGGDGAFEFRGRPRG